MLSKAVIPYRDLYVYEISGEIFGSRSFFTKDYIGCWNEGETSFLFFSRPHDQEVEAFIDKKGMYLVSRNVLDYRAWQAGEELKPFRVGNLVICPPWEAFLPEAGEIVIHLDPCVVFGTGYHPTTRSCLVALREIYQRERPEVALDLGTGSGILALATAKWGAKRVLAIDCNELAVETAQRNVISNGESRRIEVMQGRAEDWVEEEADLLCANIHVQIIDSLLTKSAFYRKRWYVLSGLLVKDAEDIERRLDRKSIEIVQRVVDRTWSTLVGVRRGPVPG